MIHDTQSTQISQKQDERDEPYIMCPSCHRAIAVITGRAHCFHYCIYIIYVYIYIYIYIYIENVENYTKNSKRLRKCIKTKKKQRFSKNIKSMYYMYP